MTPPQPAAQSSAEARENGRTVAHTVVEHLESLILDGALEPGSQLPSESELSARLGVSRLTVREGVSALQARGLIEVRHGRRPAVSPPNATPVNDFFSAAVRRDPRAMFELLDVRLAIEVQTAELAARHATRTDIAAMEMALEAMRRDLSDETVFNQADVRFHAAVAAASNNHILSFLIEGMEDPLRHSRLQSIRGYRVQELDLGELVGQHEKIFECIVRREPEAAAASMREHLVQTRKDLRVALAAKPYDDDMP